MVADSRCCRARRPPTTGSGLWSTRATLSFTPTEQFRSFLMWEHFSENDDRDGGLRGLCIKDPGPTSVGGVSTNPQTRLLLSRGCLQGSIYSNAAATGAVNSVATLAGVLGTLMGVIPGDAYAGKSQSANLREVEAFESPSYYARNNTVELNFEWDFAPGLTATSSSSFFEDRNNQRYDDQLTQATVPFANTPFTPGGVLTTPQLGPSTRDELEEINNLYARQWTQELRVQSAFDGPVNFNVGGILELESAWQPVNDFRVDGNLGYLKTEITSGQSVDPFNRTGDDPALTLVKATSSACVSPTAAVAALLGGINAGVVPPTALLAVCDTVNAPGILPNSVGVYQNPKGHELPNSPRWTGTLGAQYTWHLGHNWHSTLRADTSYQSDSYATLFNEPNSDRLRSWDITNFTLGFDNPSDGWRVQLFVRNAFDKEVISGFAVTSDALGLVRNINMLDPRLFGIVIGKSF
jgi:hypothetical protein